MDVPPRTRRVARPSWSYADANLLQASRTIFQSPSFIAFSSSNARSSVIDRRHSAAWTWRMVPSGRVVKFISRPVLNPKLFCGDQLLALVRLYPFHQILVGCVQAVIPGFGLGLNAGDDFKSGRLGGARLVVASEHFGGRRPRRRSTRTDTVTNVEHFMVRYATARRSACEAGGPATRNGKLCAGHKLKVPSQERRASGARAVICSARLAGCWPKHRPANRQGDFSHAQWPFGSDG